jgi:hypothetical protein
MHRLAEEGRLGALTILSRRRRAGTPRCAEERILSPVGLAGAGMAAIQKH